MQREHSYHSGRLFILEPNTPLCQVALSACSVFMFCIYVHTKQQPKYSFTSESTRIMTTACLIWLQYVKEVSIGNTMEEKEGKQLNSDSWGASGRLASAKLLNLWGKYPYL